ncbi:MAG: glycosyltransferase family 2 protein [Candidatus Aureabacteria bacterium]|nr:glycosyltransferase family 2 protein [Candidatus Auribacterota bacterium]
MKICAIIPAYNEEKNIKNLIIDVEKFCSRVLVIDDGSGDRTAEEVRKTGAEMIRHETNKGKGDAVSTGFAHAKKMDIDAVVLMDGDGQHDPGDIENLVSKMEETKADIVLGSRMNNLENMPLIRKLTNKFMSWLLGRFTGVIFEDSQCGFRLVKKSVIENINCVMSRFEIESELIIKAARAGYKIVNAPVETIYGEERSKIRPLRDTGRFIKFMFLMILDRGRGERK